RCDRELVRTGGNQNSSDDSGDVGTCRWPDWAVRVRAGFCSVANCRIVRGRLSGGLGRAFATAGGAGEEMMQADTISSGLLATIGSATRERGILPNLWRD